MSLNIHNMWSYMTTITNLFLSFFFLQENTSPKLKKNITQFLFLIFENEHFRPFELLFFVSNFIVPTLFTQVFNESRCHSSLSGEAAPVQPVAPVLRACWVLHGHCTGFTLLREERRFSLLFNRPYLKGK